MLTLVLISGIFTTVNAANLSISGISDAQVVEFTYYQSPVPEANNPSGNVTWSLFQYNASNVLDYALCLVLGTSLISNEEYQLILSANPALFAGYSKCQIVRWLGQNYDKVHQFTIDPFTGIVSLPPQQHSTTAANNTYYAILVATDSTDKKAALLWKVEITKNITAGFDLKGIENSAIYERTRYQSNKPYILGTPLLFPEGHLSYTLSGDGVGEYFYADSNTGQVSLLKALHYDDVISANNNYALSLVAKDDAGNTSTLNWVVTVLQLPPGSDFTITGLPASRSIAEYSAYQSPRPIITGVHDSPVSYQIDNDAAQYFSVRNDGVVNLVSTLAHDPNASNDYPITLTATDSLGEQTSFTWVVTVVPLPVRNFAIDNRTEKVQETNSYSAPIPSITGSYYPPLRFTIAGQQACFTDPNFTDDICSYSIDENTGSIYVPAKQHHTDINQNIYVIPIVATDKIGTEGYGTLTITIIFNFNKDSDGDGVKDTYEIVEDTNPQDAQSYLYTWNSSMPDALSYDADADGISNIDESGGLDPYGDNNNDGVPNYLDPYDRGDGKAALCVIKNINGYPDENGQPIQKAICDTDFGLDPIYDRDQDGIPNFRDSDSDGDGIPDVIEGGMYVPSNTNGIARDTDGDGIADYLDTDSDGDGIPDSVENHLFSKVSNNQGIADVFLADAEASISYLFNGALLAQGYNEKRLEQAILEGKWLADYDADGVANYRDLDSDGDGIPDQVEGTVAGTDLYAALHTLLSDIDSDNSGIADVFDVNYTLGEDSNGNGIDDRFDAMLTGGSDTLIAGIDDAYAATAMQAYRVNTALSAEDKIALAPNTSGKGNPDFIKRDSDGDCIADFVEAGSTGILNSFGIDTAFEGCYIIDTTANTITFKDYSCLIDSDGDGIPDFRDLDADNDGLMDVDEASSKIRDWNRDGLCDNPADLITNKNQLLDTDGDGIPDYLDLQSDGSIFDVTFVQPPLNASDYDASGKIIATGDNDKDGIDSLIDTAPTAFGMQAIDCDDPANATSLYCAGPPVDDCDLDPNAPGCGPIDPDPDHCSHPDSAQWPECFVEPAECELDPGLPQCQPPEPIDCDINYSHPNCMDPAKNPKNGKIKTKEHGNISWAFITLLFTVWIVRRKRSV